MNKRKIVLALARIKQHARDPELAHSLEDLLYTLFVEYVATGGGDRKTLRELARMVLESRKIQFTRYYA